MGQIWSLFLSEKITCVGGSCDASLEWWDWEDYGKNNDFWWFWDFEVFVRPLSSLSVFLSVFFGVQKMTHSRPTPYGVVLEWSFSGPQKIELENESFSGAHVIWILKFYFNFLPCLKFREKHKSYRMSDWKIEVRGKKGCIRFVRPVRELNKEKMIMNLFF